jgi:acyl-CoA synthetase (AMP-forming)/AMP-acid ligase II
VKLTLADFIAMNIRSFPDRQAIEVLGAAPESYTYREMWLRVSALADVLREVEPGPHGPVAATLMGNGTDALLIYLAGQLAGCAIVPVNTRLAHPEILHIVNDSGGGPHLLRRGPAAHGGGGGGRRGPRGHGHRPRPAADPGQPA